MWARPTSQYFFIAIDLCRNEVGVPSGAEMMIKPSLNPEKARRAAVHPDRPGEKCRAEPGRFLPVIDRGRCEGKRDCVEVCPHRVFECGPIRRARR